MDCHESAAWIKSKYALIESSSANRKFFKDALVEEIITVVNEKYELHYPDKSLKLNIS